MNFENTIIYLIGFAGVGKRTIGREIVAQTNMSLIDNHTINNVVFPFVHDGHKPLPEEIWQRVTAIRKIALDTMVDLGNRKFSYVFTNQLQDNDPIDWSIYNSIENAAKKMDATFVPVRLLCEIHENKKRIIMEDRAALFKNTNPDSVDNLHEDIPLNPEHPNALSLDVTNLPKEKSAALIIKHVAEI